MDEGDIVEDSDGLEAAAELREHWTREIYNWIAETHTNLGSLIAWVTYVLVAFVLFGLSPVLAVVVVLVGIFKAESSGEALERWLDRYEFWSKIKTVIRVPLFGFYFLIALRFFEVDLVAVNLRPVNPLTADLLNFLGGSALGVLVSCGVLGADASLPKGGTSS